MADAWRGTNDGRGMRLLTAVGLTALLAGSGELAHACDQREPTRSTSPGPHDYSLGGSDAKLWRQGDPGEPLFLRARVLDVCGEPLVGARVQILHANHAGYHEADRWRADLTTDERGGFELATVYPGFTGGIARHIHFFITHPGYADLMTRLFFKNDPDIDHGIEDLAIPLEEIRRGDQIGWIGGFEFVLARR